MTSIPPEARITPPERMMRAAFTAFLAIVFLTFPAIAAHAEMNIRKVVSDSGVTAWLVEDYTLPIVTMNFAFRGAGSTQDPDDKDGLMNLMTGLFDEGAGDMDSETFQKRLDEVGAQMSFNASQDALYGSMEVLQENRSDAFDLLRMAVDQPRFDQGPVDRIRGQIVAGIKADMRDPGKLAQIAFSKALYGDHPYARRPEGTLKSLPDITPADLHAAHDRLLARDNLVVGVVGAIDAETLKTELDRIFGSLPEKPDLRPVPDADLHLDQTVRLPLDVPQASLQIVYPGVARDDPRFFAAYLMNHILGGGTFSSRLFEEVRDKRGLAYGVNSGLSNRDHSKALVIGTSTAAGQADETLKVIQDVVDKMRDNGPDRAGTGRRQEIRAWSVCGEQSQFIERDRRHLGRVAARRSRHRLHRPP